MAPAAMGTGLMRRALNALLLLIALALLLAALEARAADLGKPLMLVATPALGGGYSRTVLVAVPRGPLHVGFILNRATQLTLASVFPEHAPSAKVTGQVYFGGPEMPEALFAIVARNPGGGAWQLFGPFYVATEEATIDGIIEQTPNDARYFAGFVGWLPGELEQELAAGWWHVAEPDPLLLSRDPEGAWERLIEQVGNGGAPQPGLHRTSFGEGKP